jgi:tRNA G18 (ribose-2'-O)-methylase SpoU
MSKLKVRTRPDLSINSPLHQDALINDKDFTAWQFNVADRFKSKTVEEIKQELRATAHPFAVCMENWTSDFNFSSLVRNANAFNAQTVYYLGDKKVDRRGMLGCQNYTDVTFISTIDDLIKLKDRYVFIGVDNIDGAVPISSYTPVPNTLFFFGSEGTGLTPALQKMCDQLIYIEQFGSVRSLNAAVASGIVMHDFVEKLIYKMVRA